MPWFLHRSGLFSLNVFSPTATIHIIELEPQKYLSIKEWANEDRPREKLTSKGRGALTDAELIAILIGSGTKTFSAVDVAKIILNACNNDINILAQLSVKELQKFKGIGEAKAISIVSALELGRRRKSTDVNHIKILSSKDIYEQLRPHLLDKAHEEFWIILLNKANVVLKKFPISTGGVSITTVDPKIIFKAALEEQAPHIIVAHNHPSGQLKPSMADRKITEKLRLAGDMLDIKLLDHIIFSNFGYYSFSDDDAL